MATWSAKPSFPGARTLPHPYRVGERRALTRAITSCLFSRYAPSLPAGFFGTRHHFRRILPKRAITSRPLRNVNPAAAFLEAVVVFWSPVSGKTGRVGMVNPRRAKVPFDCRYSSSETVRGIVLGEYQNRPPS